MKLKKSVKLITLALAAFVGLGALIPTPAFATESNVCNTSAPEDVRRAAGCPEFGSNDGLNIVIQRILSSIILVAGTIAVIFIIVGGINYMTSNGDTSKVEKAKKTVTYALIGLIVSALAFAIVNWVISIIP